MAKQTQHNSDLVTLTQPAALSGGGITVDRNAGIIGNVSLISIGPAKGHNFAITQATLKSVLEAFKASGNRKSRITHPERKFEADSIEVTVGRPKNARIEGDAIRADIHLAKFAENMPSLGNVRKWLMDVAEEDPRIIGMSIVARFEFKERVNQETGVRDLPEALCTYFHAADFVGDPAANSNGLLSGDGEMAKKTGTEGDDETTTSSNANTTLSSPPAATDAVLAERTRCTQIRNLEKAAREEFGLANFDVSRFINGGHSEEQVRAAMLSAFAEKNKPIHGLSGNIVAGEDSRESLGEAMSDAVCLSMGTALEKPHRRHTQFLNASLIDLARHYLRSMGVSPDGMGKAEVARLVLNRGEMARRGAGDIALSHSSGDFPNILADAAGKRMRRMYEEHPITWRRWAKKTTAPDFKEQKRLALSNAVTPPKVLEGAEYTYATVGESKEVFKLAKYGQLFGITWEAIVNDDLSAFMTITQRMVIAAATIEDDLAYAPLTGNQTMGEDNKTLFHADHSNMLSAVGTGGVDVTSLSAMRVKLARQLSLAPASDILGRHLNLQLAHILVPIERQTEAEVLAASLVDPSKSNDTKNPFHGINVVPEPRLSSNSTVKWYGAADHRFIDTIEVCFLQGHERPFIETEDEFKRDVRNYKVRHVVASRAIDHRGFVQHDGSAAPT